MHPNHPQRKLADVASKSKTKKALVAAGLKGEELEECWRIKKLQTQRAFAKPDPSLEPRPLHDWEHQQSGLKPEYVASARTWPFARSYRNNFQSKIAAQIKKGWTFKYRWHEYSVHVNHGLAVSTRTPHAGSGCITYPFHLTFDLLRQEAVWIADMLTIRAKEHRRKKSYPCWWFHRVSSDPHLHLRHGRIENWNHHEEDEACRNDRLAPLRMKRSFDTKPPKGWVTRESSIKSGNCPTGTDNFIHNHFVPFLQRQGIIVGELTGVAARKSLILSIQKSKFTERL